MLYSQPQYPGRVPLYRIVPYPMTNGVHIAYFILGWFTCGLAWIAWPFHAISISTRTRQEFIGYDDGPPPAPVQFYAPGPSDWPALPPAPPANTTQPTVTYYDPLAGR